MFIRLSHLILSEGQITLQTSRVHIGFIWFGHSWAICSVLNSHCILGSGLSLLPSALSYWGRGNRNLDIWCYGNRIVQSRVCPKRKYYELHKVPEETEVNENIN